MKKIIDSHIHLDKYEREEVELILNDLSVNNVDSLITVSSNLASARKNYKLSREHASVQVAFGFHPEQPLPSEKDTIALLAFMEKYHEEMVAIGEVGLPYYLRQTDQTVALEPYVDVLEEYVKQAKQLDKPIILHAVYEDAETACELLEKHSIEKAHFHWFKGSEAMLERLSKNGYFISATPDLLYERQVREIIKKYPISQIMVETDGPWAFEGPYKGELTHPKMIHDVIDEIATIKSLALEEAYETIYQNTSNFYQLAR